MNEKIKELKEQSYYDYAEPHSPSHNIDLEKFAELIVRECAEVADNPDVDMLRVGNAIKQHFGVK